MAACAAKNCLQIAAAMLSRFYACIISVLKKISARQWSGYFTKPCFY